MRMRKKRRLDARIEACSDLLIARGSPDPNLKKTEQEYRALVDYAQLFGRRAPVHLEVGCGNGGFVAEMARRFPEVDFIALEVCSNVILTAMERVASFGSSSGCDFLTGFYFGLLDTNSTGGKRLEET